MDSTCDSEKRNRVVHKEVLLRGREGERETGTSGSTCREEEGQILGGWVG